MTLESLTRRFLGVDLQSRRDTGSAGDDATWPALWRARLVTSKNERSAYRLTVFGHSYDAAVGALLAAVKAVDDRDRPRDTNGGAL